MYHFFTWECSLCICMYNLPASSFHCPSFDILGHPVSQHMSRYQSSIPKTVQRLHHIQDAYFCLL